MRLQTLNYSQYVHQPGEWTLNGLALGPINLLVGKNASGKTRTLNVVKNLAKVLAGATRVFSEGSFDTRFDHQGTSFHYVLQSADGKVVRESLEVDGKCLLNRGHCGLGTVYAEKLGQHIDFQVPEEQAVVATRRDKIQHPYFEPLNDWAESLYHYAFGTDLGKSHVAILVKDPSLEQPLDPKDTKQVVAMYLKGDKQFPDSFKESVKNDMATIGYPLDDISIGPMRSIRIDQPLPGQVAALCVKESDLTSLTSQDEMSQGMFRALSIIVQINYSVLAARPGCILIDDIGEGLDFERSCALIKVLMKKAETSAVQLVMSTNDRFVMNAVPLEAWSVLQRRGNVCVVRNYDNSRPIFDEFKYTGLNNFDFFATDYLSEETPSDEQAGDLR